MELALILSIIALIRASLHWIKQRKTNVMNQPPGPKGLPVVGILHQFDTTNPHEFLWMLSRKYGPIMQFNLGCRPTLVISCAKMAKEALKTQDLVFSSRPSLFGPQKLSYNGLDLVVCPYNDYWKEMKKIFVIHLFSLKRVQSFRQIFNDEISLAMQEISNNILASKNSQVIDLSSVMIDLAITLIYRVSFGKKLDKNSKERKVFDEMVKESLALLVSPFVSDYFPWLNWMDMISRMNQRLQRNFKAMDSFFQEMIDEHLHPNCLKTMKKDLLNTLIQIKQQQLLPFPLTWDHIKALLMDIFLAGSDTSSTALVWAMMALIKKPLTMNQVQTEIRGIVGKKGPVNENDLQRLWYLKAVVKETLRLYPPAPLLIPRETVENCKLEGYDIRAKTLVIVNAWAIARDSEYWENPYEFNPERLMNTSIEVKGKDFEVIPFGAGRRRCPRLTMGLVTLELTIANLLYSFDWELPSGMKIEDIDTNVSSGLVVHKKNALCLVARKHQF